METMESECDTVFNIIQSAPNGTTFSSILSRSKIGEAHLAVRLSELIAESKIQTNVNEGRLFYTAKDDNIEKEVNYESL